MGRVQTVGEATSRLLSPSRLPLRARERRLGTRQLLAVLSINQTGNQPFREKGKRRNYQENNFNNKKNHYFAEQSGIGND